MSGSVRTCCVEKCGRARSHSEGTALHSFPHPEKEKERFLTWINAVGSSISGLPYEHIYKTGKYVELKQLAQENKNLHILNLDVTDTPRYGELVSQIQKEVDKQGLNLLVNNAGVSTKFTKLPLVKPEQLLENLTVNTVAPIILTKTLLPLLKQASETNSSQSMGMQRAAVVNMSSILGSIAQNDQGGFYPYRCSKAALNAATKSMSIDLKKDQILVISMHPGWVRTDMGGKNAPLDVDSSIHGIFDTISKLGEQDSGKFFQYDGSELPW